MPIHLIAVAGDLDNVWGRTERAHERRLYSVLGMSREEFKGFCFDNSVGPFAPATSFAPQADMTGESL